MTSPTQTVQAFLDAFARHDLDAALAEVSPQAAITVHPLGIGGRGPGVLSVVLGDLIRAFPDLIMTTGQIVTTGSYAGIVEAPLSVPVHVQLNGFGSFSVELITDQP